MLIHCLARGEHIHHGYWPTPESESTQTKEEAQANLIQLLLDTSKLPSNSTVLDVGCGIGGTSRYLASKYGCSVTGITISSKQVEIANRLTKTAVEDQASSKPTSDQGATRLGEGRVKFLELDAEKMGDFFNGQQGSFDAVWISEALSHFPNKALFFENAMKVLKPGGKLVLADWFKAEDLDDTTFTNDIKPIEGKSTYNMQVFSSLSEVQTECFSRPFIPRKDTSNWQRKLDLRFSLSQKTSVKRFERHGMNASIPTSFIIKLTPLSSRDITWSLVQNPSLWAFALSQGRDGIAFLQSFRAMRRGYANGSFCYAAMAFKKE